MKESVESVNKFLEDLQTSNYSQYQVVARLQDIVSSCSDELTMGIKYGGISFSRDELLSGIYPYATHTSLEFSNGVLLKDPKNKLLGNGKFRRHLRFQDVQDIDEEYIFFLFDQLLKI